MADIFERYEKKYLLNREQRAFLEAALREVMKIDPFGRSTIRNLYYDTPDYRLIRKSLEKPVYKEKLRVRSYRKVSGDDEVFVELKKKYDGIVYKRRVSMPEKEAMRCLREGAFPGDRNQICRELNYFVKLYGGLQPRVYLNYDRIAYFGKEDPNLRISFDTNIQWRTGDLSLCSEPGGRQILQEGESLMEIKAAGAMPLWLVELMNRAKVQPASISKYGTAYRTMLLENSLDYLKNLCIEAAPGRRMQKTIRREGVNYA